MRPFHTFPRAGNLSCHRFGFNRTSAGEPPAGKKSNFSPDPFLLSRTILRNSYCTLEVFCCPVLLGPCGEEHFAGWQKRQGGHMAAGCRGRGSSGKSAKNDPGIPQLRSGLVVNSQTRLKLKDKNSRLKYL